MTTDEKLFSGAPSLPPSHEDGNDTVELVNEETHDLIGVHAVGVPIEDENGIVCGTILHQLPRWRKKAVTR